ncbi:ATP-dependent S NAD P H-hydrate dehydratase [Taenia solium]|eukprot:TsM_001034800 transcript=TsM_001034800 gene=TsM_001034800
MGDWLKLIREVIPPLSNALHKGQMGRIGVVGGSKEYTGAPYFAAITALSCIMKECRNAQKPMVVDADGIYVVAKNKELVSGYKSVILTPNVNEFSLLYKTIFGTGPSDDPQEASKLAAALGNLTIIRKGPKDIITDGENILFCDTEGSPRRCGGQGDLLSGAAAVFSHWFSEKLLVCSSSAPMIAGFAACMLTRRCAERAFSKYGRGTVTTRMIDEIATASVVASSTLMASKSVDQ